MRMVFFVVYELTCDVELFFVITVYINSCF